jgi:hypothetical protein
MHYTPLAQTGGRGGGYGMQAIIHDTPASITSIWAAPGQYVVKLTANGKTYQQPLRVKMDPRVTTPVLGLQQQFTLSKALYDDVIKSRKALEDVRAVRAQLGQVRGRAQGAVADAITAFDAKAVAIEGAGGGGRGGGGGGRGGAPAGPLTLSNAAGNLTSLMISLQGADVTPTTQLASAIAARRNEVAQLFARWSELKGTGLAALNAQLKQANLPPVTP